ncbi:MAG: glycerol-3-phosphate dehydrogenase/oxidase [Mariprofundaceae bacterium]|nr:glycerol-3-phosphate dehydrogenase/oxidase [Mariprofundaceae bacterium]
MHKTDVLVIGGGIHGCGVAQAAAAQGLRVLLVEQGEIASGTSSRSSKLIHGGLRYLETAQFSLVREALHEREILLRIAPELVRKERFYIPVYRTSSRSAWKIAAGLMLYRLFGGDGAGFHPVSHARWAQTLPDLSMQGLRAVFQYRDAATDDAALTKAVADSAIQMGAEVLTGCRVQSAKRVHDGWEVDMGHDGMAHASALVNAAGPWVNQVQDLIAPKPRKLCISLVQGSHIILPQSQEAYVYAEADDGRAAFIMPWKGKTMVGTTEVDALDVDHPDPGDDEISYLLKVYRRHYPSRPSGENDVMDCFAGVRVLTGEGGRFTGRTREVRLLCDDSGHPHRVTIYGGKLTTYRRTAERVMQLLSPALHPPRPEADTANIKLHPHDSLNVPKYVI